MAGGHPSGMGSQTPGLLLFGSSVFSFSPSHLGWFHLVCVVAVLLNSRGGDLRC